MKKIRKIFKYALNSTHLHCKYETKADLDVKKFSCGNWKHFLNILLFTFSLLLPREHIHTDPAEKITLKRMNERESVNKIWEENFNLHTIYLFFYSRDRHDKELFMNVIPLSSSSVWYNNKLKVMCMFVIFQFLIFLSCALSSWQLSTWEIN